ncbi:MAG TPA: ParB/RepB/Spo0J family partition protein [Deltaproteobacteria bacterium]|nr:ParB/RepB/Spo0J family partition protein [Deltaproteobacteria bacterium]
MAKRNALGKGLGAIFTDLVDDGSPKPRYVICGMEELRPNSFQPRQSFDGDEIRNLADSIRTNGVIQPIIVRKTYSGYEIIAGERRWRAAQTAGLREVPVIVREATDRDLVEWSLIENIQREELNPIEEADAYNRLLSNFHLSQEEIARRVGKDRSTITNYLRLLKLPSKIREALIAGTITAGHARALLSLQSHEKQMSLFGTIISKRLSVREAERLAKETGKQTAAPKKASRSPVFRELEMTLSRSLTAKVVVKPKKRGGVLEIRYTSDDELNKVVERILSSESR